MNGKHVGFKGYTEFIKKNKPTLFICGHMHEYQGEKKVGKTMIVATGSVPICPDICGLDKKKATFASDILTGKIKVTNEVIIVVGGKIGCELAWYLAEQVKKVSILEMLDDILNDTAIRSTREELNASVMQKKEINELDQLLGGRRDFSHYEFGRKK